MVEHTQGWLTRATLAGNTAPDSISRIVVDVTFLRMTARPDQAGRPLPQGCDLVCVPAPTVGFYRYLYGTVGRDYCWWLRRLAGDAEIEALLRDPQISLHVLYRGGEPGGFFELDGRSGGRDVNIGYFGLMPHLVGSGLGTAFLCTAVDRAWSQVGPGPGLIRVNTCTADHPRAIGCYLRAGFRPARTVREVWNIPDHLGLPIPSHLRA